VYYLFVRPLLKKSDETFSVVERGILLGLLAGYTIHNLFVFDNIVSYIFYGVILAYIHARVGVTIPSFEKKKVDMQIVEHIITPVVIVACVGIIYIVNVPNMLAAGDVINAFRTNNPEEMLRAFDTALSRNTFAKQEIREQLTQKGQAMLQAPEVSEEIKSKISARIEAELLKQIEEKPGDARIHVFISSFYRSTNQIDKAREQLAIARALSPRKQVIIFEQGYVELQAGQYDAAVQLFKEAYDLGTQFSDVRINYAVSALYAGKLGLLDELIQTDEDKRAFALSDLAVRAVYQAKMYPKLIEMLTIQSNENPQDTQIRTSLAFVLNESGDSDGAIAALTKAGEDIPTFEKEAQRFIATIMAEKAGTKVKPNTKVQ
jgi:tetratricopeptide (TPR) repeat protein